MKYCCDFMKSWCGKGLSPIVTITENKIMGGCFPSRYDKPEEDNNGWAKLPTIDKEEVKQEIVRCLEEVLICAFNGYFVDSVIEHTKRLLDKLSPPAEETKKGD